MSIQILINTTDMTAFVASRSLKIDMDTSHWKSCSLTLNAIKINDGVPEEGKIITVKWLEVGKPDILVFKGVINNKSIKQLSTNLDELTVSITSNGFRNIPFRRTISETFELPNGEEYIAAGNIVKLLVDTYLVSEGIAYFDNGVISSILEGKLYEDDIEFICMNIGEILDQLAKDSNANWYINSSNVLYFVEEYYSFDGAVEFDIDTELGITADIRNLDLKTDLTNYANKVFFKGDIESDSMDNIQVFSQDLAEISHMAQLDGGSGVYGISVSNPSITTDIEAQAYCDKELAKRKVKPKSISFDTLDWKAYQVGERHNINIPIIGVHNTALKPKNYVVESITLSDMGNNILSKKIEMRQLFSDVIGSGSEQVTWQKGKQGIAYFKALTDGVKNTDSVTKNMLKNHSYVENLRGGCISTQNFDGTGDYIKLERQFMTFWEDGTPDTLKMAMGFVPDGTSSIPGVVFGAGDGNGNNRAYITKDAQGFKLIYRISNELVSAINFKNDGTILINDREIPTLTNLVYQAEYMADSQLWNDKLAGLTYSDDFYYVGSNKIYPDAVLDAFISNLRADQISTVGLAAEKIYQADYPDNYGILGGYGGDLVLYYDSTEYFRVYNTITDGVSLQDRGQTFITSKKDGGSTGYGYLELGYSGCTVEAKGTWNFGIVNGITALSSTPAITISPSLHNHGITNGTLLRLADGGTVAWQATTISATQPSHTHTIW